MREARHHLNDHHYVSQKEEIIELLRERIEQLCQELLSGGKRIGHEWVCGSVNGEAGKSMHVELRGPKCGMWKDHASDDGGDVLALITQNLGLPDFKATMDWARDWLGLPPWTPDPDKKPPFDPLRYSFRDRYGTKAWTYRDIHGSIIGYVVRFEVGDGKDIIPLRIIDGKPKWKGWTGNERKPLYNVHRLARRTDASLMIVEGEKTADAAQQLFPDRVVLTWQGGSKAVKNVDWQPVLDHITANAENEDFTVVVWPDADVPGRKVAKYLGTLLPKCLVVDTDSLPDGWDLADTPPEGIDIEALLDAATYNIPLPKPSKKKPTKPEDTIVTGPLALQGDLRMPMELELPDGVLWEDICHDYHNYGAFQHQHQIYAKRIEQAKSGEIMRIYFMPVSNFSAKVLTHMEDEKTSMLLVELRNVKKRKRVFDAPTDMLLTRGQFKKYIEAKGNFHFTGTDSDFDRVKSKLMDEYGDGRKIDVLGYQLDEKVFAFNNGIVDTKGVFHEYDTHGSIEIGGQSYYVPSANRIYLNNPNRYQNQKKVRYIDSGVRLKDFAALFTQVHREHGRMTLPFIMACVLSDHIFKYHEFFPLVYLYGEPSTGKTHMTQALQRLFGEPQAPLTITGKANTDKAKVRKFAQLINCLVFLEEFSNQVGRDSIEWLKALNNRIGYERGNIDSAFGTDAVPINSGVIITGNDYPQDDALLTRLVVVEMNKNTFSDAEKERFRELTDMMERGYSSIVGEIMAFREDFEKEYKEHYREALQDMTQRLTLKGQGILERMIQNPAVIAGVFRFFSRPGRIQFPYTYDQLLEDLTKAMIEQNDKRDTGSEVAQWWDCFAAAVKGEDLVPGEDYKVDGNNLFIRFRDCHEQYLVYHQKLFRSPGLARNTISTKLEKNPAYLDNKGSTRFAHNKVTSALQFSLSHIGQDFIDSISMERTTKMERQYKRNSKARQEHMAGNGQAQPELVAAGGDGEPEDLPF